MMGAYSISLGKRSLAGEHKHGDQGGSSGWKVKPSPPGLTVRSNNQHPIPVLVIARQCIRYSILS